MGQPAQLGVVVVMFASILVADYITGVELALRALYVVPVAVASHNDSLTGIANLRGFRNLAQREIDRAQRLAAPLTLVHIDIDGFKAVNDTRGHAEGDRLLKLVAEVLTSGRALDIAARVGGDEFVLLLPETARPDAEVAVARVRKRLVQAMRADEWPVTFSMGAATFLVAPESLDHALRVADALMYDVKHGSKDAVRFAVISESTPSASIPAAADSD
jgi:diguanylate cyclase (GGDEF)-like protein